MNIKLINIVLTLLTILLTGCGEKYALDRQMEELCKKDGGVKIYETVELPAEMFDELGNLKAKKYVRKNDDYIVQIADVYENSSESTEIKKGDPLKGEGRLTRIHSTVVRTSDKKLLAEMVEYNRAGGDLFVIGHHTQSHCPIEPIDVINKVFRK